MKRNDKNLKYFIWALKYVFTLNGLKSFLFVILSALSVVEVCLSLLFTESLTNTFFAVKNTDELFEIIGRLSVYAVGIICIKIIMLFKSNLWESINEKIQVDFSSKILEKTAKIQWEYFENYNTSNTMYIVKSKGVTSIIQCFQSLIAFINSILLILAYCFFLSRINFYIALGYLLIVVVFNIYSKKCLLDMSDEWEKINILDKKERYFIGLCGGKNQHAEYVINNLYEYFYNKWNLIFNQEQDKKILVYRKSEILNRISRIVLYAPYILMMFFVSFQILNGRYEVGFLILCMDMFNEIINTVTSIKDNFTKSVISSKYIKCILEFNNFSEINNEIYGMDYKYAIALSNVSYKYPQSNTNAINKITLSIKHGERIAILGQNGSGKTTLINIISGLLEVDLGQVVVNSMLNNHKRIISVIYQDFIHYQFSVKENIVLGAPEGKLTDDKIWTLLDLVGLKDTIASLEDGLDTKLGQLYMGTDLSKGQWQRLAIARLLANEEAEIWILDEPTAYLDPNAEVDIYHLVNKLAGKRTVLYISHRLGFAKNADRILILDKGKIIESGTHKDLLRSNGKYSKLYSEQMKYMFG